MRASLIALIALVASPLMVFAAPSSQIGSLAERNIVPLGDSLSDNLGALKPKEILERVQNLTDDDALDLIDQLSDSQIEELLKSLNGEELTDFLGKFRGSERVTGAADKLGLNK